MLKWLIPTESRFFDQFNGMSGVVLDGARALREMVADYRNAPEWSKKIKDIEHRGDLATHEIMSTLNKTFVTPFDRDDIHSLAHKMDDVLDFIDSAAGKMVVYRLKKPTPLIKQFADVIVQAAEEMQRVVGELSNLSNNAEAIRIRCVELNRLENEGDRIMREGLSQLFSNGMPALEVMKLKDIYETLEIAIDKCEDVASIIETIIVKGA